LTGGLRGPFPTLPNHKTETSKRKEITQAMANVNIRPLGDRVLVQPLEEQEVKKGGIIIPDTAKEKPQEGKILSVGPGKRDDAGKLIPLDVKKGDKILFSKYGGTEITVDGEKMLIMREDDILGVVS
jgi:chaperonin GroES